MTSDLTQALREVFTTRGDAPALTIEQHTFSYSDLWSAGVATASQLLADTEEGARVGILAQRSWQAYTGVLGATLAGRPYVPINPGMPKARQLSVLQAAKCGAVFADERTVQRARELSEQLDHAPTILSPIRAASGEVSLPDVADHNHLYVMFTSGTTGVPKGVAVRRENVSAYVRSIGRVASVHGDDRCSQLFDLSFDLSVHDMFVTWLNGAHLCVPNESEILDPVGYAARNEITCWFSVPSVVAMARRFRRLKPNVLPSLRLSLFCGEPLPVSLALNWMEGAPNTRLFNLYGPTEATIAITAQAFERSEQDLPSSVPLGAALEGNAVVVVDNEGRPVHVGEVGELWLAGRQLTDGYINNPTEQALKFLSRQVSGYPHSRWYRSGDVVKRDERWGLVFQSRVDDQVKINGYRVEILEIEEALRAASGVSDVAAVPWPLTEGGSAEGVIGFVCGSTRTESQIIEACRATLPAYMAPRKIISPAHLPLNANGKIDRKALREAYLPASRSKSGAAS